jgi:hypothetical protein
MQVGAQCGLAGRCARSFTMPWPTDPPTHPSASQSTTAGEGALLGWGRCEGAAGALVGVPGQAAMHCRSTVPGGA